MSSDSSKGASPSKLADNQAILQSETAEGEKASTAQLQHETALQNILSQLPSEQRTALQNILSQLPSEQRGNFSLVIAKFSLVIARSIRRDPFPLPEVMNAYDDKTRETILDMVRADQFHRHKRGEAEDARIDRGQRLSFVFAALCLGGGIILFWINENAAGWSMEGVGMVIALREIIAKAFEWINPDSRKRKEKRD